MNVQFYQLAIGAVFTVWGRTYRKTAMSMAEDERQWGNVFLEETEVVSDGPLLPPEVAARWKPERDHWKAAVEDFLAGRLRASSASDEGGQGGECENPS
jgi:hypothetical protein